MMGDVEIITDINHVNGECRGRFETRVRGRLIHADTFDLDKSRSRQKFARDTIAKFKHEEPSLTDGDVTTLERELDALLLAKLEQVRDTRHAPGAEAPRAVDSSRIYTELTNAEKLVRKFGTHLRFCGQMGKFITWRGGRWQLDDTGRVSRFAKQIARSIWADVPRAGDIGIDPKELVKHATHSESAAGISAMLKLVATEAEIVVHAVELDANPWLLNCLNGTVDLRTGELRPHDPKDLITKQCSVNFDPSATCPMFDSFLARIMDNNLTLMRYLARVFGYGLTADIRDQELYVFHGGGANGKNVLIDTVTGIMGPYACAAPPGLLTAKKHEGHPTEIADLCGRRLIVASETEEEDRLRIQFVKRLTGDASLKGRFMRQDFFEFPRTNKTILVTNNRPHISESGNAIWRRIRLVPFNVTIPPDEQDTLLAEKLKMEWPGILHWLIAGCRDWHEHGMMTPDEVRLATDAYKAEEDPLVEFIADCCIRGGANVRISRSDLLSSYQGWAVQAGESNPLTRNAFYARIRGLSGVGDVEWRQAGVTIPVRGFKGIGLKSLQEIQQP